MKLHETMTKSQRVIISTPSYHNTMRRTALSTACLPAYARSTLDAGHPVLLQPWLLMQHPAKMQQWAISSSRAVPNPQVPVASCIEHWKISRIGIHKRFIFKEWLEHNLRSCSGYMFWIHRERCLSLCLMPGPRLANHQGNSTPPADHWLSIPPRSCHRLCCMTVWAQLLVVRTKHTLEFMNQKPMEGLGHRKRQWSEFLVFWKVSSCLDPCDGVEGNSCRVPCSEACEFRFEMLSIEDGNRCQALNVEKSEIAATRI